MRTFAVLLLTACGPLLGAVPDDLDRQRLVSHLEMTESWLVDEVVGLTPEQLQFRATPTSWNVLDCVEHLLLAEPQYWTTFRNSMVRKVSRKGSPSDDLDRLWYGIDRTERSKTVESELPKQKFKDVGPALAEFRALRTTILQYVRTTQEDWRHHLVPEWDRDCYQWLVMISAHSQRHILQIREIKHNPKFPRLR